MTEPNDQAFIKVAVELRQLENAIELGNMIIEIKSRLQRMEDSVMSNYGGTSGKNRTASGLLEGKSFSDVAAEPLNQLVPFLEAWQGGFRGVEEFLVKSSKRKLILQQLVDTYIKGGDIVAAKLAHE